MKKLLIRLFDGYYARPILYDFLIVTIICVLYWFLTTKYSFAILSDEEFIKSFTTDLLNTSISLAGFILASLTIIVTFKDNSEAKKQGLSEDQITRLTGLELLFSSKHYATIVKTFLTSVFLLLSGFLVLSLYKFLFSQLPIFIADYLIIISVFIISLTVFRCILLLYNIIRLQISSK
jgi:hypothetical protein